jgi:hypothetical protein
LSSKKAEYDDENEDDEGSAPVVNGGMFSSTWGFGRSCRKRG